MEQTYKIGEAATLLNLKTYVLRFWETEFPQIAPLRTEKGQRLYREKDIELLERIRYLLHEQGLTIDGARKILDNHEAESFIPTSPTTLNIPSPMEVAKPAPNPLLKHAHNQPTSHLPGQSASQLTNQSISQPVSQSPTWSPDPSPNQSSDKFLTPLQNQSQGQSQAQAPAQLSDIPSGDSPSSLPRDSVNDSPANMPANIPENMPVSTAVGSLEHTPAQLSGAALTTMPNNASDNAHPLSPQPESVALQAIVTELEEIAALLRCDMTKGNYIR